MTTTGTSSASTAAPGETFFAIDDLVIQLREVHGLRISKSTFLQGVKTGRFPAPIRPTPTRPVWKKSDLDALVRSF